MMGALFPSSTLLSSSLRRAFSLVLTCSAKGDDDVLDAVFATETVTAPVGTGGGGAASLLVDDECIFRVFL